MWSTNTNNQSKLKLLSRNKFVDGHSVKGFCHDQSFSSTIGFNLQFFPHEQKQNFFSHLFNTEQQSINFFPIYFSLIFAQHFQLWKCHIFTFKLKLHIDFRSRKVLCGICGTEFA